MSVAENDRETGPSTLELSDTLAGRSDTLAAARPGAASALGVSDAMAGARPDDPAALVLAQARIAGALFGGGGLGRFRVLERLGSGGMGAVYAAYDPQLDRGVALKMVHVPERRHDAVLAEAKALARLAHPNVVPVFDVGIEGDDVYIVMELVRGKTLRSYVRGRPVRDVLDVYRQAGAALAAAHAAGLVHRDFKPDNAVVGHDGRVRVVDFGLACEASEQRTPAGTPGYMAPEQVAGDAVSPAADQYSFCVSLGEALDDARSSGAPGSDARPAWLAVILARGTAAAPGDRFASMADLLRALGREPARLRRRRILGGLSVTTVTAAIAAAFFVGRASPSPAAEPPPCEGAEAEIAAAWPADARAAALDRIAGLSAYGRELAPRLRSQLDDYLHRWANGRRDACLAHARGLQSSALFDRRVACLTERRLELAQFGDAAARGDAASLPRLADAVSALRSPEDCSDAEALAEDVPRPAAYAPWIAQLRRELAGARIEIAAGQLDEARRRVDAIVMQARVIPFSPLVAEALLVEGQLMATAEDRTNAVPTLRNATRIAVTGQADAVAVEAWARAARLVSTSTRFTPQDGRELIEALAARPSCPGATRAQLYSSLGTVEIARGHREFARRAFERAQDELRRAPASKASPSQVGAWTPDLATIYRGLAFTTDDPARRDVILAQLEAEQTRRLGPHHPETLTTRYRRAQSSVVALGDAAAMFGDTCDRLAAQATLRADAAQCWESLGEVRGELGDAAAALAAFEQAERQGAAQNRFLPEAIPYLNLWRGDAVAASRQFAAALDARPRTADEPWFDSFARARLQLGVLRAERRAGLRCDPSVARTAVSVLETTAHASPATTIDRLLARARGELAYCAPRTSETIDAARAAVAQWRHAGTDPDEVAALERWITAAPGSPR